MGKEYSLKKSKEEKLVPITVYLPPSIKEALKKYCKTIRLTKDSKSSKVSISAIGRIAIIQDSHFRFFLTKLLRN